MKIRLIVIEDHPVFLKSLLLPIEAHQEINVMGQADNGQSALELIQTLKPDIAVMDFHLPGGPGPDKLDLIHQAKITHASTQLIILTGETNPNILSLILKAGAQSVLSKNDLHDSFYFIQCIYNTYQGTYCLPRGGTLGYAIHKASSLQDQFIHQLNPTEIQAVRLLANEIRHEKIAHTLDKSPDYIRQILRNARNKLCIEHNHALKQYYHKLFPIDYFKVIE